MKILNDDADDCRKYYYYSYKTGQSFWRKPFFLIGDVLTKEEFMQDFDIKMTEMDEIIKNNCKEDDIK